MSISFLYSLLVEPFLNRKVYTAWDNKIIMTDESGRI